MDKAGKCISTHVLDLVRGKPAADVPARLEKQDPAGDWRVLASARTDQEGRCPQLLPEGGGIPLECIDSSLIPLATSRSKKWSRCIQ